MKQKTSQKNSPAIRDPRGRFLPGHPIGADTRWRNVSGNPAGNPLARRQFEQAFYQALMGEGSPDEAAKLLWDSARAKEPWAVQALLARVAPQEARLKITPEGSTNDGTYDLTKLSDDELRQLVQLAGRACGAELANRHTTDTAHELPAGGASQTPTA
jgi:hypothetical protein